MSMICSKCGKTVEGEGMAFCPYCGAKLTEAAQPSAPRDEEAEKWIQKALAVTSYPDRRKTLLKGLEACPGNREIRWELLFTGEDAPRKGRTIDYSVIKSWILDIYRNPGDFSAERKERMRSQLFDDPGLKECLSLFDDPGKKQQEYIQRLCREYVSIFLEGSSEVMGRWFGFQLGRNSEKRLAVPVAAMIGQVMKDEKLLPEQREQLRGALYQAYASCAGGKTEYLDERLNG